MGRRIIMQSIKNLIDDYREERKNFALKYKITKNANILLFKEL